MGWGRRGPSAGRKTTVRALLELRWLPAHARSQPPRVTAPPKRSMAVGQLAGSTWATDGLVCWRTAGLPWGPAWQELPSRCFVMV